MNSAIVIGVTVLLGVLYSWTSRINGLYFFGRTADAELRTSEAGRAITRRYLTCVALTTVAAAALAWAGHRVGMRSEGAIVMLAEVVVLWMVFARANAEVRRLAQEYVSTAAPGESVIQVALLEQPTYWVPGLGAVLLPLALCAGSLLTAVMLAAHGAGLSSGWTAMNDSIGQSYSGLLGLATGMLAAAVTFLIVFRVSARLRTKMAQYTVRAMVSLEWIATVLLVTLLACNHYAVPISRGVGRVIVLAAMLGSIGVALWNQSRHKRFVPPPVEMGGDDRWHWGLFYVDRSDPALFVQSRCGAGYTLNYGRVAAWPISLGLVAYVVGVLFLLPRLR